jgi:epsilon-lactone hydrolase
MRTFRHHVVALSYGLVSKWIVFRTKLRMQPGSSDWIKVLRAQMEALAVTVKEARVAPIEDPKVKGFIVNANNNDSKRAMLYFHGGAYAFGSARIYISHAYYLAQACEMPVYLIDYRLAPENGYKEALEDALLAYDYLIQSGYTPENIILAGDSAGGGLSLALLFMLREQDKPMPAACVCISPWVDLLFSCGSVRGNYQKDYINHYPQEWFGDFANWYVKDGDVKDPLISPMYGDFHSLPPLLIHTGGDECLLDENTVIADKAKTAGNQVTFKVWPDMPHDFHLLAMILPEGKAAIAEIGEYVKKV